MIESDKYSIVKVPADDLRKMCGKALYRSGVREDILNPVAEGLVWTNLRGIDSHGVCLLPHYIRAVKGGRLNPDPEMHFEQTGAATGIFNADHTFGHAAGKKAMEHAIQLAAYSGMGSVSVSNSSHCGALSWFAHEAAKHDMIGLAFTNATARLKTPGSVRAFFGNNPICLVAPMQDEDPFCFDAATSKISFNAVKAAAAAGVEIKPGMVTDVRGMETTDPNLAALLMPIGSYKGFGLSMMVDILCSLLSGMPNGNRVSNMYGDPLNKKRLLGQFYCAIRIDFFCDPRTFKSALQDSAHCVRAEPALENCDVFAMVPGDPEKKAWQERSTSGVPVPDYILEAINNS